MSRHLEPLGDGARGDERVSAYLDGELDVDERARFETDLAADPQLAEELSAIAATRAALRAMPDVAPRRDLTELGPTHSPAGRRWAAAGAVALAGVAALWIFLAVVVFSGSDGSVVPPLDDLVGQHESAAAGETSSSFVAMKREEVDMAMKAPDAVGGMGMDGVFQSGDLIQLVYTDGLHNISVFHQDGHVDWADMPEGEMMTMAGDQAWHSTMHGADVVVVDSDDGIMTVVADGNMATEAAEAMTV